MEPVTEVSHREAVIAAHGSPSDPLAQDAAMAALASRAAAFLPGWTVRGATIASPRSFERAFHGLMWPLVYPFFMADGYFTGEMLPKRIAKCSSTAVQLPPFGSDPALASLAVEAALSGARAEGLPLRDTTLLLAAHGSQVSPASRRSTLALAETMAGAVPFRRIVTGFIEEAPCLSEAACGLGQSICLPLFTLRAGHVENDVPAALAKAGFTGVLLPHLGSHIAVPGLIAASLARHATKAAA